MPLEPLDLPELEEKLKLRQEVVNVAGVGPLLLLELDHDQVQGFHDLRNSTDHHQRRRAAPYVISLSVRRPNGTPMYTADAVEVLMKRSAGMVDLIGAAVLAFCKATPEAQVELGEASAATNGPDSA